MHLVNVADPVLMLYLNPPNRYSNGAMIWVSPCRSLPVVVAIETADDGGLPNSKGLLHVRYFFGVFAGNIVFLGEILGKVE